MTEPRTPLEIGAVYENGVLKPDQPLPLNDYQRVTIMIKPRTSRIRDAAGLLKWRGDPEVLRRIAEDPELSDVESQ